MNNIDMELLERQLNNQSEMGLIQVSTAMNLFKGMVERDVISCENCSKREIHYSNDICRLLSEPLYKLTYKESEEWTTGIPKECPLKE